MKRLSILLLSLFFFQNLFSQNNTIKPVSDLGFCTESLATNMAKQKPPRLQAYMADLPTSTCDESTFVRLIGEAGADEEGMCIVPSGDGNLYIGGRAGSQTLIIKMGIDGNPIWQRLFDFTSKNDILSQLLVDSDGNVVGCGYGEDGTVDFIPYVFKYDPISNAVLWVWNYSNSSRCFNVIEPAAGSDYILTMDMRNSPFPGSFEDAILREIYRNTGATTGNLTRNYNIGSSETFSNTIYHDGQLYATGRYTNGAGTINMRHSLTRFDLTGNEIWTRLSHVPTIGFARLYGRDMLIENDEIFSIASGDDDGSSATVTNFFLQKNTLDGDLSWAKKYDIPSMQNEWTEEIVSVADGFLMLGYDRATPTNIFLLKTDKNGDLLWAKRYGDLGNESLRFTCESQLFAEGGFIYFTGWSDSYTGSRDLMLVKTDSEGNLEDECLLGTDITVIVTEVSNPANAANAAFDLIDYPNSQTETSVLFDTSTVSLPFQDLEGCICEEVDESCDTTFLKTYGTLEDNEESRAITAVPASLGGGFLLGGGKGDSAMITLLDPAGDIIWTRSFDATFNAEDVILDINFDSEDMIFGVGNTKNEPDGNIECFAFRYDMVTNTMLWINELDLNDPAHENYRVIMEKAPGGNYVVGGQTNNLQSGGTGCDGILVELDRNAGTNVWQRNMHFGSCETFINILAADGGIYAIGRYNFDGGGQARFRPGITKFDLNGNQLWTRWYLKGQAPEVARLYGVDIVEDNGLVAFGYGDDDGIATDFNELFIFRTDYDGNLEWAMQYDIPGSVGERSVRIINLPDGYLCLGFHDSPDRDAFIFKIDKEGNLLWSKNYGEAGGDEDARDMLWTGGQIYFTGKTTTPTGGISDDIYLASIAADGATSGQDSCNLFTDLEMTQVAWQNPYEGQHDLEDLNQNWLQFISTATMGETAVQTTVDCFISCIDSCDLLPEAVFENASATCDGSGLLLSMEICNTGNFDLPTGTPVSVYENDPTAGLATVIATISLPSAVGAGTCENFNLPVPGAPNTTYFILINEDGTTPTPIDLSTFEGSTEECDFTNNLGSFFFDFEEPFLNLGPDLSVCASQTITLDAGSGFITYEWNDLSNMQTLTVTSPGTYSVTVTDECGGVQSDEITISIDPAAVLDIGPDQNICVGGGVDFDLASSIFVNYEWSPATYLDCATCAEVTATPPETISYTVEASNADGTCTSMDSVTIFVSPGFETIADVLICEGDTVLVFGNPVSEAGEFTMTFTTTEGCDSIHTVSVGVLDTVITQEEVLVCWGDSVVVFGEVVYGGTHEMTFTGSNGCDSTHVITVVGHPKIFLIGQQANVTCYGGSDGSAFANVLGGGLDELTYLWNTGDTTTTITDLTAGEYSVTVTDGICPEEANFTITQPDEIVVTATGVNVLCDNLGSANAMAEGGTDDFTYMWSNGDAGANTLDLEEGFYTVTATDDSGCTGTATVEITGTVGPTVAISIDQLPSEDEPEGGALSAIPMGGAAPFTFDWSNGGTGASQNDLASGEYTVTITDGNGCTAEAAAQIYLPACTGGKIWNDRNRDGCQDGGELGIQGIELALNGTDIWGNAITMTTTSAINGEYIFEPLPPGDYQVTLPLPADYNYSPVDACTDDFTDSDFELDGVSYTVELEEGHCCLVVDGGLYDACNNVYNPGEICCDQVLCGPGNDPVPITSVAPAIGANNIEYMWVSSTNGVTWNGIPNTNSPDYDPGPIQETTHFARCVRAIGCTEWLETAPVTIAVNAVAVADISVPPYICIGNSVDFSAADNPAGATYSWNFGPYASPNTSTEQNPSVVFTESGYPTIWLSVTYNDCTSTDSELVAVSNSPVYCNQAMQAPGLSMNGIAASGFELFPNPAAEFITLRWSESIDSQVEIELLSIDGRQLFVTQVDGDAQSFQTDLSEVVTGVYVLRIRYNDGEVEVFRVVKE